MADDNTFELGLVMAGAISAGAYTAGVMDFLIEALDAFEAAKKQPDWDGPTHDVRVPLMAGASAGGMTSAMAALQAFHDIEHVRGAPSPPPAPDKNRLYSNWVTRIDLKRLLETGDLDRLMAQADYATTQDGVRSLLCCDILDAIVHETFDLSGAAHPRPWLGRGNERALRVLVTLTNLRGVPYSFEIVGQEKLPYAMLNHGDYLDFNIGLAPHPPTQGTMALDIADTTTPDWEIFRTAALATGAFPVGLAPRTLRKPVADYATSLRVGRDTDHGFETIPPASEFQADPYQFVTVDGGTIDNEPLEIGRRLLAEDGTLEDDGIAARKAIILIAPFPSFIEMPDFLPGLKLADIIPQLASTLIQQSRFKADELAKAANERFFSRFLISPERDGNGSPAAKRYPIASGVLHGFGGFIDESFRRHDYLLGRRNAQAFLRYHLALPDNHQLFAGTRNKDKWHVREPGSDEKRKFAARTGEAPSQPGLPIIPLPEDLRAEIVVGPEDQPRPDDVRMDVLAGLIRARVAKVVEVLVDHDLIRLTDTSIFGWAERLGARHYLTEILAKKGNKVIKDAVADVKSAFTSGANDG